MVLAHRSAEKDAKRGKDIEVEMEINLEDVLRGKEKEIYHKQIGFLQALPGNGSGTRHQSDRMFYLPGNWRSSANQKNVFRFIHAVIPLVPNAAARDRRPEKPCNVCKGEGRIKEEDKIKIFIPAGVDTNQVIKVEGKGEAGKRGGKPAIYMSEFLSNRIRFSKEKEMICIFLLPISFSQAALGDEIESPTLDGTKILLKVPSGTESGKVLRISGKGIPRFSGYGRGNLYVELIVKTPKKLTKKQKELLEELKEEGI